MNGQIKYLENGMINVRLVIAIALTFTVFSSMAAQSVMAQGLLIPDGHDDRFHLPRPIVRPIPPNSSTYRIADFTINSRVEDQIARTQVGQTFVNTGNRQIEVCFCFPLPYDGAVDQMTFMVDNKEYEAKLLPADEARRIYEGYVRRYQDPALLEWIGHGMFKTSVFPIPPGAKRTVTLQYTQLLEKFQGVTDYLIPLSTAKYTSKPLDNLSISCSIKTRGKLKNIYSPTHGIDIERPDDHHATIKLNRQNVIPTSDLRILFDTDDRSIGASVVSFWPEGAKNGYYVLMASPEIKRESEEQPRKSVIFVVDRSGSMNGKKIEQAKEAAKFVLNNLREGDLFNIVAYDTEVEVFKEELQKYSGEIAAEARGFIEGIYAGGSTNIDGALTTALEMIQDRSLPNYVVFLTDGLPTVGETREAHIAKNAKANNDLGARIISFGVGYDVNSRLLDRITRENHGQSQYVKPDEDLETHVSQLYAKISAPVLTDVSIAYDFDDADRGQKPVNRVYPKEVFDLFAGQQLVLVGRYNQSGRAKVVIKGNVGENSASYEYNVDFAKPSDTSRYGFVAKLWAARRIGEIIDLIDLEGRNQELIDELVRISTKHGIVTQYTSYLADDQGTVRELTDFRGNRSRTMDSLQDLELAEGQQGFSQRRAKAAFKDAGNTQASLGRGGGSGGGGVMADSAAGKSGFGGQNNFNYYAQSSPSAEKKYAESIRSADDKTVYKRGNVLVADNATDVDLEKDKDSIVEVTRFSDEYFKLLADTNKSEKQILALQGEKEELIVRLNKRIYRIK